MNRLVFVAALLAGCGGNTSLLLDLSVATGVPQPASLRVTLYAQGVVGAPQPVPLGSAGHMLPGRLIVRPLEPSLPNPRVLVDGLDAQGKRIAQAASGLQLSAGKQTEMALVLDRLLADSDGDGVPDAVDDCPTLADPDQRCGAPGDGGADFATDGPTDLGHAPSCPTPHLLCDDFETGNTSKWNQVNIKGNTSLNVDGVQTFGGSFALDVTAMPNAMSESATVGLPMTPTGLATLASRMYVRTPAFPGSFALFEALFANTSGWAVGVDGAGNWVVTQDQGNSADLTTAMPMPLNTWVCVELIVDPPSPSNPPGRLRLNVDGMTLIDTPPANFITPTIFYVGLVRAPGTTSSQYFIDDVVLANQPIGCE